SSYATRSWKSRISCATVAVSVRSSRILRNPPATPRFPRSTMLGINKFDADGNLIDAIYRRGAEGWHTDGAYNRQPFKATQLYALAVPSRGGDTLFANGYAAYDALPDRLKKRLDGVMGAFSYGGRRGGSPLLDKEDQDWEAVFHPIIRTHP